MRKVINAAADTLMLGLLLLSAVLSIATAVKVYPLNPYWVEMLSDYSGGFVRRFLLGEILNHIPGVSPKVAGLALLTACYLFVTVSLYVGLRRLKFPLFIRIAVLFSPFGVAFYLLFPTMVAHFILRDILIVALAILAARMVCYIHERVEMPGRLLVCDAVVFVSITFGMLCHSGMLFCTPPILLMYLAVSDSVRRSFVHAAILGIIFLGEFLTVNLVFGELDPERVMDVLDMFKSRYPGIPIAISPDSFLFSLFAVSSGGESHWVGMARQQLFSTARIIMVLAAAVVPCLIFLLRFIRSGLCSSEYFRRHWLVLACSASAFSPVLMSAFSIDFFRWLVWSFMLSVYFAMQLTEHMEEEPSAKSKIIEYWPIGSLLAVLSIVGVIFYTPARDSAFSAGNEGILEENNLEPLVSAVMMHTDYSDFRKKYFYVIANDDWNWEFDTRTAVGSVENSIRIRKFDEEKKESYRPEALESGCDSAFLSVSISGRRMFLRGWEALTKRRDDGRTVLVKPAHGMGFLIKKGDVMFFYPTMPLTMNLQKEGYDQKIPFAFEDYVLIEKEWLGSKITIYPAFLNGKSHVFYCTSKGKKVVLPEQKASGLIEP